MHELPRTQLENTLPCMLIWLRQLVPLAGRPQLEQSGPIDAKELTVICVATQSANLGFGKIGLCVV